MDINDIFKSCFLQYSFKTDLNDVSDLPRDLNRQDFNIFTIEKHNEWKIIKISEQRSNKIFIFGYWWEHF